MDESQFWTMTKPQFVVLGMVLSFFFYFLLNLFSSHVKLPAPSISDFKPVTEITGPYRREWVRCGAKCSGWYAGWIGNTELMCDANSGGYSNGVCGNLPLKTGDLLTAKYAILKSSNGNLFARGGKLKNAVIVSITDGGRILYSRTPAQYIHDWNENDIETFWMNIILALISGFLFALYINTVRKDLKSARVRRDLKSAR